MPISWKYRWEQTLETVDVFFSIKGKSLKTIDILVAETVIKVSHPPYLADLDLAYEVDYKTSKALRQDDQLILRLKKRVPQTWEDFLFGGPRNEALIRRQNSLDHREKWIQELHKNAVTQKLNDERKALKKQMAIDKNEWELIEEIKIKEKESAETEMYASMERLCMNQSHSSSRTSKHMDVIVQDEEVSSLNLNVAIEIRNEAEEGVDSLSLNSAAKCIQNDSSSLMNYVVPEYLPPRKTTARITFKHTPRIFKTPIRESTALQEKEFIMKNRPYLQQNNLLNQTATDISNEDPVWLLKKGDDFYNGGDLFSAINAYSLGLEKDRSLVEALSKRSACYLNLGEIDRCISDCDEAKTLIQKQKNFIDDTTYKDLLRITIIRLGCACSYSGSMKNIERALNTFLKVKDIYPADEVVSQNYNHINRLKDALKTKVAADQMFGNGKAIEALKIYQSVDTDQIHLMSATSNRAAAHFLHGEFERCVDCCTLILQSIKKQEKLKNQDIQKYPGDLGSIPIPGSQARRKLVLIALIRRGVTNFQLQKMEDALDDFMVASKIARDFDSVEYQRIQEDVIYLKRIINNPAA